MKKMRKCFICIIMTIALILSVTACSSDDDDIVQDGPGTKQEIDNNQSSNNSGKDSDKQNSDNGQKSDNTDTDAGQKNDVTDNTNSQDNNGSENSQGGNTAQNDDFSDLSKNIKMSVNGKTGDMTISRRSLPRQNSGDPEGWTIFVYLCATALESKYGMGTGDLAEMLDAAASNKVRFVVQTGGTKQWQNQVIDTSKSQRYLVQNEDIQLVDEGKTVNMGDAESLKDFLVWGLDNYSSQHIGLILWNHGGGSITRVCFDETNDWDSLDLKDLDEALAGALNGTGKRFDFIGFDACLMGTIETANILTTYADYMYGSEETEPGSGWDYTEIGS
ncbi:MAG: hypothetical protein J6Y89_09025 [Lachnospiraceae bacterium]|nr:hypothetical protein [Lachnospiraceae bacterium]